MKVYQLKAEGSTDFFKEGGQCYSKRLFGSRAQAESDIPRFKKACTTPINSLDFACLEDNEVLKFKVLELELDAWEAVQGLCEHLCSYAAKTYQAFLEQAPWRKASSSTAGPQS